MTISRTIIKVFLASPGDLTEERQAAKRIVDEENANHANAQGYHIELVGWEDTVAQHGRAQEIINRDLDQCSFFVGALWKRWGTPPGPKGSIYSSGFEEEYRRSEDRRNNSGKPMISMLFKNISTSDKADIGPQLEKVLEFKREFTEGYRGAFQTFEEIREFEGRFRAILALFLRTQQEEDSIDVSEEKSKTPSAQKNRGSDRLDTSKTLFEEGPRSFLIELAERPHKQSEFEYTPTEAARFRLLAASLHQSENDDETLGVHDANLLFRDMRLEALSEREIRGLIKAGLADFSNQNKPLWHWLFGAGSDAKTELIFRTIIGNANTRANAFKVLKLLKWKFQDLDGPIALVSLLNWWIGDQPDNDLLVAALGYLGECGDRNQIDSIDTLLGSASVTVVRAAITAKTLILARESAVDALNFLAKREDADVPRNLASALLSNASAACSTG